MRQNCFSLIRMSPSNNVFCLISDSLQECWGKVLLGESISNQLSKSFGLEFQGIFFASVPISPLPVIGLRTSCHFVSFPGQPTYHCQINLSKEQFWITFLLSTQVLCDLHCNLDQIKYIKLVVKSFQSRTSDYLVLAFYSSLHISPYSGGVLFKLGSAKHQRLITLITLSYNTYLFPLKSPLNAKIRHCGKALSTCLG